MEKIFKLNENNTTIRTEIIAGLTTFMTMAYISLACVPELRLTNRGLVDCRTFRFADLFP